MFHNITTPVGKYDISVGCSNWCKEQIGIHLSNITIENLFVIAMAMGSLLLHKLLWHYDEWLIENTEITRNQIDIIYKASGDFAFFLMGAFLVYYTVFQ